MKPTDVADSESVATGARVAGFVLTDNSNTMLAGRSVVINGQRATTGEDGSFSLEGIPDRYDAVVLEPNKRFVSIHYGLTTRNPFLRHVVDFGPPEKARITGKIDGMPVFPLPKTDTVEFSFVSEDAEVSPWTMGYYFNEFGPAFGPIRLFSERSGPMRGTLIALGLVGRPSAEGFLSAALASQSLSVGEGETVSLDLALSAVSVGNIAGSVGVSQGESVNQICTSMRLPGSSRSVFPRSFRGSTDFDLELPDLSSIGATYCVAASNSDGYAWVSRCGLQTGTTGLSFRLMTPPQITRPLTDSPVTKDSRFTWTPIQDAVYRLDLSTWSRSVAIYTTASEVSWPDLSGIDIPYQAGLEYVCDVTARAPYRTIDDFAVKDSASSSTLEMHRLGSNHVSVTTVK